MAIDFTKPLITQIYNTEFVPQIIEHQRALARFLDGEPIVGAPVGAKRYNAANDLFEEFTGATWQEVPLAYVRTNAYTAGDVLAKLLTVDGSGSGIDADRLDGFEAAQFARLAGAAFGGNVAVAGDLTVDANALLGNYAQLRGPSPTQWWRDTDGRGFSIHTNSGLAYLMRGGVDDSVWSQLVDAYGTPRWMTTIDLGSGQWHFAGPVVVFNTLTAQDIYAVRGVDGALYLGNQSGGQRWLYYNGTDYEFNGAGIWVNGGDIRFASPAGVQRAGYREIPLVGRNFSAAFVDADRGRCVIKTDGGAYTWTVNAGLPDGCVITVRNAGVAGNITIGRGAGITLRRAGQAASQDVQLAPWGMATLLHGGGGIWVVSGTGIS
jgi:hypothetical protein